MTLRAQVVEAMAQALYEHERRRYYQRWAAWDDLPPDARIPWRLRAIEALDAALDVLGEQLEEVDWQTRFTATIPGLLAALRAGKSRIDDPAGKGSDE